MSALCREPSVQRPELRRHADQELGRVAGMRSVKNSTGRKADGGSRLLRATIT
jgi:hypothetical protein